MVPVIAPSHIEALAALRTHIVESCRREFALIADEAANREGANQDFQTIAILGFAADAGFLS